MEKISGILDKIQKTLCPDIWDESRKLRKEIKSQIIERVQTLIPLKNIKELYLIGSTTGYQWTEDSDIDINVTVDPPELISDPLIIKKRKQINGNIAKGTLHPINFFLVPWNGKEQFWGDSAFGVYDILKDRWVVSPDKYKYTQQPEDEFYMDIKYAENLVRYFYNLVDRWKEDLDQLDNIKELPDSWAKNYLLEHKIDELRYDVNSLISFCKDIDKKRKLVYNYGFGIPRKSTYNIIYKLLENSKYAHYFEFFKELKVDADGFYFFN